MTANQKDSYRTPEYVFLWLDGIYNFTVDGCASSHNALCKRFVTEELNFLEFSALHVGDRIFVNPPYSNPKPFVERAAYFMALGCTVVMLLPSDKSTQWYQVIQDNATEVIDIVGGRINFLHPVTGEEVKGNNKGSMVAVFDPNYQGFVTRQVSLDFIRQRGGLS